MEPIILDSVEKLAEHFGTEEGLEAATAKAAKVIQRKMSDLDEFLDLVGTKQRCYLCGESFVGKPKKKGVSVCKKCLVTVHNIVKEDSYVGKPTPDPTTSAVKEYKLIGKCPECGGPFWNHRRAGSGYDHRCFDCGHSDTCWFSP